MTPPPTTDSPEFHELTIDADRGAGPWDWQYTGTCSCGAWQLFVGPPISNPKGRREMIKRAFKKHRLSIVEAYTPGQMRCSSCDVVKPFDEFSRSRGRINGRICKVCRSVVKNRSARAKKPKPPLAPQRNPATASKQEARGEATRALIDAHRCEWDELYAKALADRGLELSAYERARKPDG